MTTPTPLGELAQALSEGLARPRHAWEAAVIIAALAIGWLGSRLLAALWERRARRRRPARAEAPPASPTVGRVLFPLCTLLLLAAGETLLRQRQILESAADARLLRLAMSLVWVLALVRVVFAGLRRVFRQTAAIAVTERAIVVAAVVGLALYATGAWDDVVTWLESAKIPLGSAVRVSLWSILVGGITTLGSLLSAMWFGSFLEDRLAAHSGLDPNLRIVLGRVLRALLLLAAVLFALAVSGIDLTVLSVFGGALGVGLGLGLQRIASNYVSGFILLLDRSLRIGDMVAVDKYYGQVTKITTRYTVLRALDGTDSVVPNEMLVSSPVVNLTLGDSRLCLSVALPIAPEADLELARQKMIEAARGTERVLAEPAPLVLFKEVQGGNIVLEASFWIADPQNGRQSVQSGVALAAIARLREVGIRVAAPRSEWLVAASASGPSVRPAAGSGTEASPEASARASSGPGATA